MRLALVGVGPWGRLLARKMGDAGAKIVAYARGNGPDVDDLGMRVSLDCLWRIDQLDGIIAAATPEVTMNLACHAAAEGLAVLATKPLMLAEPVAIKAPFFVDYVRLWSRGYVLLKGHVAGRRLYSIDIDLFGNGPLRPYPSLDDYGSHALAFVHDLLGQEAVLQNLQTEPVALRADGATIHCVMATVGTVSVRIRVGNGADSAGRRLTVGVEGLGTVSYEESSTAAAFRVNQTTLLEERQDPVATMAAQFVLHFQSGLADPRFVGLSLAVTRSLEAIRHAEDSR